MPCVLPVISLKIFGFVQQAGQSRARIFRSGLAFIAGIFVWFLGLALVLVIIKSAGGQPVWAAQFTNPYFVLCMSAVVLVFALNLFGVFEINLPQWLSRRAVAAEVGPWGRRFVFPGSFRDRARDAVHRAVSRDRAWLRFHSIGHRYSGACLARSPWE